MEIWLNINSLLAIVLLFTFALVWFTNIYTDWLDKASAWGLLALIVSVAVRGVVGMIL